MQFTHARTHALQSVDVVKAHAMLHAQRYRHASRRGIVARWLCSRCIEYKKGLLQWSKPKGKKVDWPLPLRGGSLLYSLRTADTHGGLRHCFRHHLNPDGLQPKALHHQHRTGMLMTVRPTTLSASSACLRWTACKTTSRRSYHAIVPNRTVISASGRDSRKLLQNLTTNDLNKLDKLQFCAFLTPQGRTIASTFMFAVGQSDLLIDVDTRSVGAVLDCIRRFKLRSKVTLSDASEEMAVMAHWGGEDAPSHALSSGLDVRTPGMGWRSIVRRKDVDRAEEDAQAYTVHRILQGVAESADEVAGLPMEANLDIMNGVDFRKGCYLGQELTARTHHTGVVRKRIVPVSLYTDPHKPPTALQHEQGSVRLQLAPGTDVRSEPMSSSSSGSSTDTGTEQKRPTRGRSAGKLVSYVDNVGLAMLRLEQVHRWNKDLLMRIPAPSDPSQPAETAKDESIYVRPWIPDWWPADIVQQQ